MANTKALPGIGHVGYMVENVDESTQQFKIYCGIDDFIVYDFVPKRAWVCEKEIFDCKFKIALSMNIHGPKIELIQHISGEETPHLAFIKGNGQNIHHIAYYVDDYEYWHNYYAKQPGSEIIFEAEIEDEVLGKRCSFYARNEKLAGIVEISMKPKK